MKKKQREFWQWFDQISPEMPWREISLRKTFKYLDTLPDPIIIVETGCARNMDSWRDDGSSTLLWDRYVQSRGRDSHVYSVDINPVTVEACKQATSERVTVTCSDSVLYLANLNHILKHKISMLYLDSFDVDWLDLAPSALHHLKELAAIRPSLTADTLVAVDDAPLYTHLMMDDSNQVTLAGENRVGGKGRYVGDFAKNIDAKLMWCHYQTAWTDMA